MPSVQLPAFDDLGAVSCRIRVSVLRMALAKHPQRRSRWFVHELATDLLNTARCRLLREKLDVSCLIPDSEIVIVWTERGGPAVWAPEGVGGFGGKMIAQRMASQLGASIEREWHAEGVVVTIRFNKDRLAR